MRVEVAGPARLVVAGAVVDGRAMGGVVAQRVLAALALSDGPVSRDALGDAVWGEALPRTWETALRGAVSKLRRAAANDPSAGELVRTAFGAYQLDPEVPVDVREATSLVIDAEAALRHDSAAAMAAARRSATVLARPLLAGLDGEWIDEQRARLVPLRVRALLALSSAATALSDHVAAGEAAREAVACDRYAEVAHQRLMTALAAAGDRAAALAAYRQCRELLTSELGVEPSADTDAVRRAVLEDRVRDPEPVLPTSVPASLGRDLPLVGRRATLDAVITRFRRRTTAGCVLVGAAGVGKSRLAAEVAHLAHGAGAVVVHARVEPDDVGGLGCFAELLGQLDVAWPPTGANSSTDLLLDRAQLARAACGALRSAAARRPLVVVLDDLHWADRSTIAILEHVAMSEIGDLFVIATAREDWLEPSLSGSAELHDRLDAVVVPPLDRDGVLELIEAWAGHRPDEGVVDGVVDRTAGNPFYVLALLQDVVGRGGDLTTGLHLPNDVLAAVPPSVRGIVESALDRLGPNGRQFATVAAVLGDEFRPTTVGAITRKPTAAPVQRMMTARLVARSPQDPTRLRWVHALVRDAVLGGLSATDQQALHRRAVEVLEAEPDEPPAVLLRHLLAAASPADATRITALAASVADDLTERGLGLEATGMLEQALAAIGPAPSAARAQLLMVLAMAELSMDHVVSGRSHLAECARTALAAGDTSFLDGWWSAVSSRAAGHADDEMIALVERVLALTEPGSRRHTTALGWLTIELVAGPEQERALAIGEAALAAARRIGDEALLRQIVHTWHLAARVEVPAAERRVVVEEVLGLRAPQGKRAADLLGWVTLAGDCLQQGDADAAAAAVRMASTGTAGFGSTHLRWIALRSEVMLATKDGRLDHAEAIADQAAAMAASMPWPDAPGIQVMQLILLRYHQGRLHEVQPFMAAVAADAPEQIGVLTALAFIESELRHPHAPTAVDDVVRVLRSVTTASSWLGVMTVVLESMAKVRHPRTAEIAAMLEPFSGDHSVITALCYFGAIDRVLGLAAAATGDTTRAVALLSRAEQQHIAIGSPLYTARTRRELADVR